MSIVISILGIVVIVAGIIFSGSNEDRSNLHKLMYGLLSVVSGVLLLLWASLVNVGAGKIGIVKFNNAINVEYLKSGWHLINPIAQYVEIDPRTKYYTFNHSKRENESDTLHVKCNDGSIINVGLSLLYHIIPGEKAFLSAEGGLDCREKIISPISEMVISKVISDNNFSGNGIVDWNVLAKQVRWAMKAELKKYGIKAEQLLVSNWNSPHLDVPAMELQNTYYAVALPQTKTVVDAFAAIVNTSKPKIVFNPQEEVLNTTETHIAKPAPIENDDVTTLLVADEAAANPCKAMDENTFDAVKQMVLASGTSTYQKLTTAQQLITSNCFTANQVSDFLKLLPTKDAQLEFAKQAYLRTVDKNKFYVEVANNFGKTSKRQLVRYIMHLMREKNNDKVELIEMAKGLTEGDILAKAMDDNTFDFFKQIIARSKRVSTQLDVATQVAYSHYFTAEQVAAIVKLLPDNDSKLAFAEVAFPRTIDRKKYTMVAENLDKFTRQKLDDYVVALYAVK